MSFQENKNIHLEKFKDLWANKHLKKEEKLSEKNEPKKGVIWPNDIIYFQQGKIS